MSSSTSLVPFQGSYYNFSDLGGDIGNPKIDIAPRAPEGARMTQCQVF